MSRLVHLVRHGQASAGQANYDRLSPRGRAQAEHLGRWWHEQGFACDAAWHGTLERQRDTASLALDGAGLQPPVNVLPALDEYDHRAVDGHLGLAAMARSSAGAPDDRGVGPPAAKGTTKGTTSGATTTAAPVDPEAMTYEDYATVMRRWRDTTDLPDSLEHWHTFADRGWNAIRDVAASHPSHRSLVFFTSGGIISTVLASVLGLDFEHTIDAIWRVRNASITSFAVDGEAARLVAFNTVAHLEVQRDPDLITLI